LAAGARVQPILTRSGARFVGAATLGGLAGRPVLTEMFDPSHGGERHVELARESDAMVVVPATADFLARLATGRADDLLTATVLCARGPVLVAPAMHPTMWHHPATTRNVATLAADGRVRLVGPVSGEVASGDTGLGRMAEPEDIVAAVIRSLAGGDLAGRHVVVSAGPTLEDIDAVRFIGNRSSGKMGFAIAAAAERRGARVTLVTGPVQLETPAGVHRVDVRSALQMQAALDDALGEDLALADALVMSAAVGDYRAAHTHEQKLKRGVDDLSIDLVQNPDVVAEIGKRRTGPRPVLVGFAVETGTDEAIIQYARDKLSKKRVDVVVANHAGESMGRDDNRVTLVEADRTTTLPTMHKSEVAERIVDLLASRLR
jgi:phosphopantothenoylcysteine decarboxylase/phosphopantothenate--cysteine ligase